MKIKLPVFLGIVSFVLWAAVLEAAPAITGLNQRPWIINDGGKLKSETELIIDNGGTACEAWVKISVQSKSDYMESLGTLAVGKNCKLVHVLELEKDGDNVTFALFDNSNGTGVQLNTKTCAQQKIRHWRFYVGHNSHLDIGYTDYQEILKDRKWPGFWDQALLTDMPDSDTWPDESKVRLEVEGVYQLDTTLRVRSADWFETLKARLLPIMPIVTGEPKSWHARPTMRNVSSKTKLAWIQRRTSSCVTNRR
jgi:hypothetical protein